MTESMTGDPDDMRLRIKPMPRPTYAELAEIPLGSELIALDWDTPTPQFTVSGYVWDEKTRDGLMSTEDDDGRPFDTFILALPPAPNAEEVATELIEREGFNTLDRLNRINLRILRELLTEAARKGGAK